MDGDLARRLHVGETRGGALLAGKLSLLIALAMVAASCAGSDDDESSTDTSGTAAEVEESITESSVPPRLDTESPEDEASSEEEASSDAVLTAAAAGQGTLIDATEEYGLDEALVGIRGHAVAAADVNDDGWEDLFVGTFADRDLDTYMERGADGPAPDRLLLGSASGFEVDETFEGRLGRTAGAEFADLDNDGDPDLVVSRNPREGDRSGAPTEIYRNDEGTLIPATVLDRREGGRAIGILDFDGDGNDDIVLVKDRWSGEGTALFRNDGELMFTDVTRELGFPDDVTGLGIGVGDLDNDGFADLVVGGSNRWFLGDGSTFAEAPTSPLPWTLHGNEDDPAHVILADVNGDGALDVFIGQHFNSTVDDGRAEPVRLFLNGGSGDGPPVFSDVTEAVGLPDLTTKSPKILLLDLDGTGQPDLITSATYSTPDGKRMPVTASGGEVVDGLPGFVSDAPEADDHYWIDGVIIDANRDGRDDVFFVEWEPALSARLLLNLPADP